MHTYIIQYIQYTYRPFLSTHRNTVYYPTPSQNTHTHDDYWDFYSLPEPNSYIRLSSSLK